MEGAEGSWSERRESWQRRGAGCEDTRVEGNKVRKGGSRERDF